MLAITGATGTIGSELVRLLADRGAEVRALSRHPADGPELPGVEWREVDLADRDEVRAACRGAARLFVLTGNTDAMVRLQTNAIDAAVAVGLDHVVKLSALGASDHSRSAIALWHHNVERYLRGAGVGWTVLRPHHFMQNLLDPVVHDRAAGTVHSASGDGRIPFIDTRDVAACAAAVLTRDPLVGEVLTLTGPRAVSYEEATAIVSDVLGRDLTYVAEDVDEAWARMRAAGMPAWLVGAQLAIAGYQRAGGPTESTTDTVEQLTGSPPRDIERFARDHRVELLP